MESIFDIDFRQLWHNYDILEYEVWEGHRTDAKEPKASCWRPPHLLLPATLSRPSRAGCRFISWAHPLWNRQKRSPTLSRRSLRNDVGFHLSQSNWIWSLPTALLSFISAIGKPTRTWLRSHLWNKILVQLFVAQKSLHRMQMRAFWFPQQRPTRRFSYLNATAATGSKLS